MTPIKKLSVASINSVRGGFKEVTATRFVGRILGIVRNVESKPTNFGVATSFKGDFLAFNAEGKQFISPACYLPGPAEKFLIKALTAKETEGKELTFAFDFFVAPTKKGNKLDLGYEFQVTALSEITPLNNMAILLASVTVPLPANPGQPELPGVPEAVESVKKK